MLRMYEGGGVENPAEVVKRLEQVEMFDDKEECEERGEVDGKEEVEEDFTMGLDCVTSRVEEQDASVSRELESDLTR